MMMKIIGTVDGVDVILDETSDSLIYTYKDIPNISIVLSTTDATGHYRILGINSNIKKGYITGLLYFLTNDLKYKLVVDSSFGLCWVSTMYRKFRCTFGFFVTDSLSRDIEDINLHAVTGDLFIHREEWDEEYKNPPLMMNGIPFVFEKRYFIGCGDFD